jgi:hypothetical protein
MASPSPIGANGRGPRGRFTAGNKGGPGNPYAARVGRWRELLAESLTDKLWTARACPCSSWIKMWAEHWHTLGRKAKVRRSRDATRVLSPMCWLLPASWRPPMLPVAR